MIIVFMAALAAVFVDYTFARAIVCLIPVLLPLLILRRYRPSGKNFQCYGIFRPKLYAPEAATYPGRYLHELGHLRHRTALHRWGLLCITQMTIFNSPTESYIAGVCTTYFCADYLLKLVHEMWADNYSSVRGYRDEMETFLKSQKKLTVMNAIRLGALRAR